MIDDDDPLLAFLAGEVARIEGVVDGLLAWPGQSGAPTGDLDDADQSSTRWSYRFTWQQVERARRYVIPLPADDALNARRSALAELDGLLDGSAANAVVLRVAEPRIRYRAGLNAYEIDISLSFSIART